MKLKIINYACKSAAASIILSVFVASANDLATTGDLKLVEAEKILKTENSRKSLDNYKKEIDSRARVLKPQGERVLLYVKTIEVLRSMLRDDFDPNYMPPTSIPLPDSILSSGSDPNQIIDPKLRQQAVDARNALEEKINKHNFQRALRREMESIKQNIFTEAGINKSDSIETTNDKLKKAGLTGEQLVKLTLLPHTAVQQKNKK